MKKNKLKSGKELIRHSVTTQIAVVFTVILMLAIGVCFLINNFFLEDYYVHYKQNTLKKIYSSMNSKAYDEELSSNDYDIELRKMTGKYGVDIIIISSGLEPLRVYANSPEKEILMELQNKLWGFSSYNEIILKNDDYVMASTNEESTQTDFIEMWGTLCDDSFFLLRTPLESIRESVKISNRFLLYVGSVSLLISIVVIIFMTRRISKPVLELADISNRMADMDFETRYEGHAGNEIDLLGHNINRLSDSLESTITKLKNANAELLKDNENKTMVDNMRKEFIANVSHELKTPIALIQGYAEGLEEGVNEASERDYYCDVIIDEAGKLNKMVKQLLNLNMLEFGNTEVDIQRFDIVTLINNYISSAEILARQNDITIERPQGFARFVWADEFLVEEVLANFFTNAVNHCESDEGKRIRIVVTDMDYCVKISIINTGKPIPAESIDRIWDKFYKVDKSHSREYGGSGVGLSIVKAIMDIHNQNCGVNNLDGEVEFWFTLDNGNKER